MSKRTKRISKALDAALVRACELYGPERTEAAGGFSSTVERVDAAELRSMFDLWWRFNLLSGAAIGTPNAFERGAE